LRRWPGTGDTRSAAGPSGPGRDPRGTRLPDRVPGGTGRCGARLGGHRPGRHRTGDRHHHRPAGPGRYARGPGLRADGELMAAPAPGGWSPQLPPVPPRPTPVPRAARIEVLPGTGFGVAYPVVKPTVSGLAVGSMVGGIISILVSFVVFCFG